MQARQPMPDLSPDESEVSTCSSRGLEATCRCRCARLGPWLAPVTWADEPVAATALGHARPTARLMQCMRDMIRRISRRMTRRRATLDGSLVRASSASDLRPCAVSTACSAFTVRALPTRACMRGWAASTAHRGPDDDHGYYLTARCCSACAACRSSISPAAISRSANEDERSGSSATARSTTFASSRSELERARASLPRPAATARSSCTPTRSTAMTSSRSSTACTASRSGIGKRRRLLIGRDRLGIKPLYYLNDGAARVRSLGSEGAARPPA